MTAFFGIYDPREAVLTYARSGHNPPIVKDGKIVGEVTSGTLSPTLGKSIAMGYVDANLAAEGTGLDIDLKGTLNPAKIVKLPFYKRSST